MKCNKCGYENTAGSRFCSGCGSKLEKLCPRCQAPVAPNAAFCSQCGFNMADGNQAHSVMNDNVIAGDVDQSIHTHVDNTTNNAVNAQVVHIYQNTHDEEAGHDLRCHACGEFSPLAQKFASQCYGCGKHFCRVHLQGNFFGIDHNLYIFLGQW